MIYPNVLQQTQHSILQKLASTSVPKFFYLAGGTAVALQLGHRMSLDFDWFTHKSFDPLLLTQNLQNDGVQLRTESIDRGTLHGRVEGVLLTFLEYRYPLLEAVHSWKEYAVNLASLDDLACMKLAAIASRGARKDFIDVYAIGTHHKPLQDIIPLYQEKFGIRDIGHLLYSLSYFEDAEQESMPEMIWDLDWPTIKSSLQDWTRTLVRK